MSNHSNQSFVVKFISDLARKGVSSPDEICSIARNEINDIEKKLNEVDPLRIRKSKLVDVLKHFDQDNNVPLNQITDKQKLNLREKILAAISDQSLSNRQLIQMIGQRNMDAAIIQEVASMTDEGILLRQNDEERKIRKA